MANVPLIRRALVGVESSNDGPSFENDDQWSPAALEKAGSTLKALNRMAKRPPVAIGFEDIGMAVKTRKGEKHILHKVSGEFRSGELACIIGPSGAGKSTLLNILSGYITYGLTGQVTINGQERRMKIFKKLSTYIMQDDLLQPWITVGESMRIAADLKLGTELGKAEKQLIIEEILQTLDLWKHKNTMSQRLSGGQLKRLAIALELVNNPPIMFLDEPTTGLDVVSVRQLTVLLRLLSRQGRTIICTIHQPSATLFSLFDRVYVLAQGRCCYQGTAPSLVPFLAEMGYVCPKTHNPADFVLETLANNHVATAQMSKRCLNGKLHRQENTLDEKKFDLHSEASIQKIFVTEYPTSFMTQFLIILKRILLQFSRDALRIWLQLLHHVISGLLTGTTFYACGNDAKNPMVVVKYCLCVEVFFMFTYAMVPILLFPIEIKLMRREFFNQWYSLRAFYAAKTLSAIPSMLIFTTTYVIITYLMSGQPLEWNRFLLFNIAVWLTSLCSEGIGLLIGSVFDTRNGAILGPSFVAPLLAVACYGFGFGASIESFMKFLMGLSYVRFSLSSLCLSLFSNRPPLKCTTDLCVYSNASIFLRDMGMIDDIYWQQTIAVCFYTILFRVIGFMSLTSKLVPGTNNKIMIYINTKLKRK